MSFADQLITDLDVFINSDEFAVSVVYNGGDAFDAVKIQGSGDWIGWFGNPQSDHATLIVKQSDVADPQYRDTAVISGETWYVHEDRANHQKIQGDQGVWLLPIKKDEKFYMS